MSTKEFGKKSFHIDGKLNKLKVQELLSVLTMVLVACLIAGVFSLVYFGWPYNQYISAIANDVPWVRPGAIKIQMNFGVHYFGDFLQPLDWAKQNNPWTADPKYLAQYPPFAVYILKPLTIFPYRIAALIYLLLMITSSVIGIWLITKKLSRSNKVLMVLVFGVSSVPFLMAFDRGNLVGFFVLLICLFIFGITTNNKIITWLSLGIMISIKIYPVLLLLVLFRLRRFQEMLFATLFTLLMGLILFAITPGAINETITQFINANTGGFALQSNIQIRTFAKFFQTYIQAPDAILQSWEYARSTNYFFNNFRIGLLGISILILLLKPKLQLSSLLLLGCLAMTAINSSQIGYNWFWAPVFVAWLISNYSVKAGETDIFPLQTLWKSEKNTLVAATGFVILTLPFGLHFPGSTTSLTPYIGLVTGLVSIMFLLFPKRRIISIQKTFQSVK
jgi:hypothetical protein